MAAFSKFAVLSTIVLATAQHCSAAVASFPITAAPSAAVITTSSMDYTSILDELSSSAAARNLTTTPTANVTVTPTAAPTLSKPSNPSMPAYQSGIITLASHNGGLIEVPIAADKAQALGAECMFLAVNPHFKLVPAGGVTANPVPVPTMSQRTSQGRKVTSTGSGSGSASETMSLEKPSTTFTGESTSSTGAEETESPSSRGRSRSAEEAEASSTSARSSEGTEGTVSASVTSASASESASSSEKIYTILSSETGSATSSAAVPEETSEDTYEDVEEEEEETAKKEKVASFMSGVGAVVPTTMARVEKRDALPPPAPSLPPSAADKSGPRSRLSPDDDPTVRHLRIEIEKHEYLIDQLDTLRDVKTEDKRMLVAIERMMAETYDQVTGYKESLLMALKEAELIQASCRNR